MEQAGGGSTGQVHVVKLNERDLLDYRAIQRTFDGAYARTALGQLCYAIVILRLFQAKFFYVGMVYAILGIGFVPVAVIRYRMAASNADRYLELDRLHGDPVADSVQGAHNRADVSAPNNSTDPTTVIARPSHTDTVLRKTFLTAGSVVAAATLFVVLVETALFVLIMLV